MPTHGFVRHAADRIVPGSEVVSSAQMLPRQYAHLRSIPESTLSREVRTDIVTTRLTRGFFCTPDFVRAPRFLGDCVNCTRGLSCRQNFDPVVEYGYVSDVRTGACSSYSAFNDVHPY